MPAVPEAFFAGVHILQTIAEIISFLLIATGIAVSVYDLVRPLRLPDIYVYDKVRFVFSRYLVLALEFELASDILGTLISPSWDQLGRLAVIAAIRTFLNYFLQREISSVEPGPDGKRSRPSKAEGGP